MWTAKILFLIIIPFLMGVTVSRLSMNDDDKFLLWFWGMIFAFMIIIAVCAMLTSCTPVRAVEVPVALPCPALIIPKEPHYPVADLKTGDKPAKVAQSYAATLELQRGHIRDLETRMKVLNGAT